MIEKLHTTTLPPPPHQLCVAAFVDKQVTIGMKVLRCPVIDWKIHCPSDWLKLIALHNNNTRTNDVYAGVPINKSLVHIPISASRCKLKSEPEVPRKLEMECATTTVI